MDKSVLLSVLYWLMAILSFGINKNIELLEEIDELGDFQMESPEMDKKWNFPAKANYEITNTTQFLTIYGKAYFNSTFIRSMEKINASEGSQLYALINITFTDEFIKTLPNRSSWVVVEGNMLDIIRRNYEGTHLPDTRSRDDSKPVHMLMYVNGRFHRSMTIPWVTDSGISFFNHRREYKVYPMHNLTFLPEGQKRSLSIKMAMVTHHTIYNYYQSLEDDCLKETEISDKAIAKLNYDMLIIAKELKGIYKSLKLSDDELHINLVKTLVTRTPEEMSCMDEDRINRSTIDGDMASSFCRRELMAHENPLNIPKVDFLVVYTRDKIYFNSKIATGVVFAETMCVVNNLVIIYWEDVNSNAVMTAQMLALTLGIEFDGDLNDCDPDNKFLMTESLNEKWNINSFNFSSCSGPYADRYIERMDRTRGFNCLDKHDGKKLIEQEDPSLPLPGLMHDLNEQCGIIHGRHSFYCGNKNVREVEVDCKAIRCFDNSSCRSTHKFVLDGTPCANSRMCMKGKCVVDGRAPKVLILPDFNRGQCKRSKEMLAVDLVSRALVHEYRVTDHDVRQEDAYDDGADHVDDNDGADKKLSIEENRKEVVVHH